MLALSPLAVAVVGLTLNNQHLMTYHWVLYFSVPAGLPITVIAALAATVMSVRDFSKGNEGQDGQSGQSGPKPVVVYEAVTL